MRIGPVEFASPWLLVGLLAAGIPPLLHLLNSRRAREAPFPTLRFLQHSVRRTARRRRIRHWLLLLLRSVLLAVLAVAVAQLIVHASGGAWGGDQAAVLILDNSASMETVAGSGTRFGRAAAAITELIQSDGRPAAAAWMATCDTTRPSHLITDLQRLRDEIAAVCPTAERGDPAACIRHAFDLLADRGESDKRVYVFSDLQRTSFEALENTAGLQNRPGVRLLIVDTSVGRPTNTGITALTVRGRRVVDQTLTFAAELRTSAISDPTVTVRLEIDGKTAGPPRTVTVRGSEAADAKPTIVQFTHAFDRADVYTGRVVVDEPDDLTADNQRWFALTVADRARALIIAGAPQSAAHDDGGKVLLYALDPRTDSKTRWSIRPRLVRVAAFGRSDLDGVDAVFCANVPSLGADQLSALADFTRGGGRLVLFLGADIDVNAYNQQAGELLPGRLVRPVGRVGPDAPAEAIGEIIRGHAYFEGLVPTATELQQVLTQRYYQIETPEDDASTQTRILVRLANNDPLLLSRTVGRGEVVLCTTTASLQWTNLPSVGLSLFVPMLERISLAGIDVDPSPVAWTVGETARIVVPDGADTNAAIHIIGPDGEASDAPIEPTPPAARPTATFRGAEKAGLYRWTVGPDNSVAGAVAVNTDGSEFDLGSVSSDQLRAWRDENRIIIGASIAEVHAAAAGLAAGTNLSQPLLIAVIILLILETRLANRQRRSAQSD